MRRHGRRPLTIDKITAKAPDLDEDINDDVDDVAPAEGVPGAVRARSIRDDVVHGVYALEGLGHEPVSRLREAANACLALDFCWADLDGAYWSS